MDRASVWLVPTKILLQLEPRLEEIWTEKHFQTLADLDAIYQQIFSPKKIFAKIIRYLKQTVPNLNRGDLVLLEPELGYRNNGKYFYDGETLMPPEMTADDAGHIPNEFQVITEFPINYWEGQMDHNSLVPFDVEANFTSIGEEEIVWLPLDQDFEVPYFFFTNEDDETYYLVGDYLWDPNNPQESSREELTSAFVDYLNNAQFLSTHPNEDFVFPLGDIDHILYLDFYL